MSAVPALRGGILGLGTVGGGTISVLRRNADVISRRAGRQIEVVAASARDITKPRNLDLSGITLCKNPVDLVKNPNVDVVVELIGGTTPAKELVIAALENGKHVVTANKALIALHGSEIFEVALKAQMIVAFEATVAGGIPVIKAVREGLAANRIGWLAGIINGTCNFILSAMSDAAQEFETVLSEAQALGYAEADPSFDIDGIDAAHKLAIIAAIAFGVPLQFESIYVEGIRDVSRTDVDYAARLGYRIKHLAMARQTPSGIELRVHPTLVPNSQLLANVDGVMNAIMINGDAAGPTLFYGSGAGAEPTASAVVADLIDVARDFGVDSGNRVPPLAFQSDQLKEIPILSMDAIETAYYLRLHVLNQAGVMADVTRVLGAGGISIEAILQQESEPGDPIVPIIILVHPVLEQAMNQALAEIAGLSQVFEPVVKIRMDSLV